MEDGIVGFLLVHVGDRWLLFRSALTVESSDSRSWKVAIVGFCFVSRSRWRSSNSLIFVHVRIVGFLLVHGGDRRILAHSRWRSLKAASFLVDGCLVVFLLVRGCVVGFLLFCGCVVGFLLIHGGDRRTLDSSSFTVAIGRFLTVSR